MQVKVVVRGETHIVEVNEDMPDAWRAGADYHDGRIEVVASTKDRAVKLWQEEADAAHG